MASFLGAAAQEPGRVGVPSAVSAVFSGCRLRLSAGLQPHTLSPWGASLGLLEAAWWDGQHTGGPRASGSLNQEANLGNRCKLRSVRSLKMKQKTKTPPTPPPAKKKPFRNTP